MSYAQRKDLTGNPILAWVFTIIVVGGLMYAIVTGLAYNVIKKATEDLKTFDVEEQPPPPEEPPPPPKDMPDVPPPPTTPPPLVRMNTAPPPIQVQEAPAPPVYIPPVAPAPPAPPPPPHKTQSAQSARGDLRTLFSNDDYPASAVSSGAEGTVRASLSIGPDGRVTGCSVTQSSGNSALDSATCNVLRRRAKFTPARDSNGNPTSDTISTPAIVWRLEG